MQPRSLQQVLSELDSVYQPQIDSIRQRQASLPDQLQADQSALNAQKDQAYTDILNGARRRGMGFSGIPLQEQAQYNATQYAPALAHLTQQSKDQAQSLEDAILGLNQQKYTQGQSIYENDRNFAEQQRQFNENLAMQQRQLAAQQAAASAFNPSLGYGGGSQPSTQTAPQSVGGYGFRNGKDGTGGYAFVDDRGNPISAYDYATKNGINFYSLLGKMAASGDAYARSALNNTNGPGAIDRNKFYWLFNATAPQQAAQPKQRPSRTATAPFGQVSIIPSLLGGR